jgi:tripartite motif-containing protein 71
LKRFEDKVSDMVAVIGEKIKTFDAIADWSLDPNIRLKVTRFLGPAAGFVFMFISMSLMPFNVFAAPDDVPAYFDSIIYDEEGARLGFPSAVFYDTVKDEIYVIDNQSRFIIYTSDFFPLYTVGARKGVITPADLSVDGAGNVYVAMPAPQARVAVFNSRLRWDHDFYFKGFEGADSFSPFRLFFGKGGMIYVAGYDFAGVLVLDSKGQFIEIISPEDNGEKVKIRDVITDDEGRIYLLSEESGHIYVYDSNRKFLFQFGDKGGSSAKLSRPQALGIDNRNGRIYVADYMRHAVNIYDKEGKYIAEFGGLGWSEGWFQHPVDIAVDSNNGRIYVADLFNNRVQVFQAKK